MTLDEEIEFWKSAKDKATSKEIALVTFGLQWGLLIAKNEHLPAALEPQP